ncbi:carbohydrate ABC transporter permease [Paenibacillus nasutitermitis]|uniref:Glycerol-3-phosphate ABC transporter permease n=1 Tax=Paenibacillus nasutitermitis TaxID=1652958 RepID=A0A916Z1W4_9BACL|nr:sugar ABC transporter permease [Paenibacillus nasutitermitis]GGD72059.1 glycerol-3-phosphate ABC transporter permease [Paenibacillus nasutitermitis]
MSRKMRESLQAYMLLSPILTGLLIFSYYPPIRGLAQAFFEWIPATDQWTFVGLNNFSKLAQDDVLIASVPNMLILLFGGILIGVTVPLVVAELIFFVKNEKLKYSYRVMLLVPLVVPGIVGLLVWNFIYDPNIGLINSLLDFVGLDSWKHGWLSDSETVLYAMLFLGFPWAAGIAPLIYLSGLMNIPTEVLDSARLEGATGWKRVLHIDIPLVTGQIKFFIVTGMIGGLQDFGRQLVLTDGGPGYSSMVPGYHMYKQAFTYNNFGYASAIGLVLFVFAFLFTVISMKYIQSDRG